MTSQLLVNVLAVGPLAPGASVTRNHGLCAGGKPVVPTQVICDRASSLVVSNVTDTSFTVTNPSPTPQRAVFRAEFDHSIHASGATPIAWQGAPVTGAPGPAFAASYGSFSDSTQQPIPASPATLAVSYDTDELLGGVTAVANGSGKRTRLTVPVDGVYAFDLSPQMAHSGGATETLTFWAAIDGVVVPRSASSFEMGNNNNRTLPFLRFCANMTAGQYLEWFFTSTSGTGIRLEQFAAAAPAPAIPSVIANVQRIA
jgi:hypothetical protein